MLNGMSDEDKSGILYGGSGLFLFGTSGALIASEEVSGFLIRALLAVVIPTCAWLVQHYTRKLVMWWETRKQLKE